MITSTNEYSHTIGIASFEGRGFMNPIDVVFNNNPVSYTHLTLPTKA